MSQLAMIIYDKYDIYWSVIFLFIDKNAFLLNFNFTLAKMTGILGLVDKVTSCAP